MSSNHCSFGTVSTEGQYIMPLYWLCPVSAVLNCPHFLHALWSTLRVSFRTLAGGAGGEERLTPRACGAATRKGPVSPCEAIGVSITSWAPGGGAGRSCGFSAAGDKTTGAEAMFLFLFSRAWPTVLLGRWYWWAGPGWGGADGGRTLAGSRGSAATDKRLGSYSPCINTALSCLFTVLLCHWTSVVWLTSTSWRVVCYITAALARMRCLIFL